MYISITYPTGKEVTYIKAKNCWYEIITLPTPHKQKQVYRITA